MHNIFSLNKTSIFIYVNLLFIITSCNQSETNDACNGESTRRDIKIATDIDAVSIDTLPIISTVDSIGSIVVPEIDRKSPRQEIENKTFTITGKVEKVKKYHDGDWKVKLISADEKYLNCEIPNPDCEFAKNSVFYQKYLTAYQWVEDHHETLEGDTVTITGIAFIDIDHPYPRNSSENNLELHPVLTINF
ncbi:MAG: hypothetical protein IPM74_06805 [Crocinitomicaceae bacterium]|nr:hypothetical protein [Crocinitomicaceae bacterium]MBK8925608.1 hypothetical protein [Crocinitomicaceae bacterium]